MNPFLNIIRLVSGDFLAKTLNFLAFIYLARVLGVASYGILEFAISIVMYFLLLADGGLELWATRQAAQVKDIRQLVARIVPLRLLLAVGAFVVLLMLLPVFPNYPALRMILMLFGLTLFTQTVNLKWVFMGQEKMTRVATGLVVAQIVFAVAIIGFVRSPAHVIWVPVLRVVGDLAMTVYFARLFTAEHGRLGLAFTLRGARSTMHPALTMGTSHGLALLNYNFDTVLLGFLLGPMAVGWYNAAYKPVTVALAMPVTYFLGLFPVLSRAYVESREVFRQIVVRSIRLMSIIAVPIGVGGTFLAEPIIDFLFGPDYASAVPALQVLSWSAVLVILRGTYRQAFNAAGRQRLDLRCAGASTALNLVLNLLLIPRYGIIGAAVATLVSEIVWLTMSSCYFYRYIIPMSLLPLLLKPVVAAIAMGLCFWVTQSLFWVLQAFIGVLVYFGVLMLLGETEVRSWVQAHKVRVP